MIELNLKDSSSLQAGDREIPSGVSVPVNVMSNYLIHEYL